MSETNQIDRPVMPGDTNPQQSEAYQWARAFESAFIRGDYAEAARLAGERNLLIPAVKQESSKP